MSYGQTLTFGTGGLGIPAGATRVALRMKMHYQSFPQPIGVKAAAGAVLPAQGVTIGSTGTYGESTQKVEVTQLYPAAPSIFDYTLYSGAGGIRK